MGTSIIIIAILVIAVLALVWRVVVLERKNSNGKQLFDLHTETLNKRYQKLRDCFDQVEKDNQIMLTGVNNQLSNLKGEYSKELKKLESENKVLLAKCTFLEACNEEAVKRKEPRYKKGEFIKEVGVVLSTTTHPVSYGQMKDTFKCSHSSLTYALSNLIKQNKVKRLKQGVYQWVLTPETHITVKDSEKLSNLPITI